MCFFNVDYVFVLFGLLTWLSMGIICKPSPDVSTNNTSNITTANTVPFNSLHSALKEQPLAEINVSFPLLDKLNKEASNYYGPKINQKTLEQQPLLGLELFPKGIRTGNTDTIGGASEGNQDHAKMVKNISGVFKNDSKEILNLNRNKLNTSENSSATPEAPQKINTLSLLRNPPKNNKDNRNATDTTNSFQNQSSSFNSTIARPNVASFNHSFNNSKHNLNLPTQNFVTGQDKHLNSTTKQSFVNFTYSKSLSNDTKFTKEYVAEASEDREWCNKTSLDTITCRNRVSDNTKSPHVASSQFSGNIGIKSTDRNGTRVLGGETNNNFNETMKFKVGKSDYDYRNLTNFHNCSGCLKNKKLIQHNTSEQVTAKGKDELSEISKLRTKLLNSDDKNTLLIRNHSRGSNNSSDNFKLTNFDLSKILKKNDTNGVDNSTSSNEVKKDQKKPSNSYKNTNLNSKISNDTDQNKIENKSKTKPSKTQLGRGYKGDLDSSGIPQTQPENNSLSLSKALSNDEQNVVTTGKSLARDEILLRKCEEMDNKRDQFGKKLFDGMVTNCVTKRKLISTKHTKKKKNGKVVKEKDEDSELKNSERAKANEENAKSNEKQKQESEKNADAGNQQALSNEKILQEILRGDDGTKSTKVSNDNHHEDIENKTIRLDPTIIAAKLHPPDEDGGHIPDADHRDEDTGMIGMDDRPAIEEKLGEGKNDTSTGENQTKNNTRIESIEKSGNDKEKPKEKDDKKQSETGKTQNVNKEATALNSTDVGNDKSKEKLKSNSTENPNKDKHDFAKNTTKLQNNQNIEYMKNVSHIENKQNANVTENEAESVGSALDSTTSNTSQSGNQTNPTDDKESLTSEKEVKKILAFGDSLTKGLYRDQQKHSFYNPYSKHLTELLGNGSPNKKFEVYEEGVNGECACGGMTKRLPQELDAKKDLNLVIIIAGTNDLLHNDCIRKCDLFEAIKKLHLMAKQRKIKSVVSTILLSTMRPDKMTPQEYKDVLFDINQKLRGFAMQQETQGQMKFCDIADELPRKAPLSWDKIHPGEKGYTALAQILYDCIKDFKF